MASAPPSSWATASAASRWPRASEEVAVLLSGGVDSSVALRLLHDAGVRCRAFYLRIWLEDEQAHASRGECPWEEDWACASAVCEQAGVPLEAVSLQDEYSQLVVEYLISEAAAGRTPNPDIMCNSRIKFGAFLDKVGRHFAAVASGHYARSTVPTPSCAMVLDTRATRSAQDRSAAYATAMVAAHGDASKTSVLKERELEARVGQDGSGVASAELPAPAQLLMSADPHKDQTYFLSQLRQDQLERVLFPIGHLPKSEVRALAEELQLPNRQRKDSQGICFLGQLNYDDFLRDHLGERPGPVFEFETKQVIGTHRGLWFHTVGQRRGLVPVLTNAFAAKGPWYVVKKDVENNALHVSREYTAADKSRNAFNANSLNWLSGNPPAADGEQIPLQVKVRHGAQMHDALVTVHEGGARVGVQLSSRDKGLAPGQFAAFYDGDVCLGSGVITEEVHS
uniref:tRNA-5-taurinomethyluridine 2-sulfurtransferase n=1 Tax=Chrysotila carterae TaxID=13221 RepID=A0A7S4BKU4_CHRCT